MTPLQDPQIHLSRVPDYTNSVFFYQYHIDSLKLENQKTLIALSYRPRLNVFADAGFNSTLAYRAYKNFGTSFGINISVPIYDGRQKKLQFSKIAISERTRINNRDFFFRQYQQQLAQLTQQLNATENLIELINKQVKYTETLISVNGKLLETGDIKLTDYVMALNNYFNAKNLLNQNYISHLNILNQLNYWDR
jgi:outer membrane protein TolC